MGYFDYYMDSIRKAIEEQLRPRNLSINDPCVRYEVISDETSDPTVYEGADIDRAIEALNTSGAATLYALRTNSFFGPPVARVCSADAIPAPAVLRSINGEMHSVVPRYYARRHTVYVDWPRNMPLPPVNPDTLPRNPEAPLLYVYSNEAPARRWLARQHVFLACLDCWPPISAISRRSGVNWSCCTFPRTRATKAMRMRPLTVR